MLNLIFAIIYAGLAVALAGYRIFQKTDPKFPESALWKWIMRPAAITFVLCAVAVYSNYSAGKKPDDALDFIVAPGIIYLCVIGVWIIWKIISYFTGWGTSGSAGGEKTHIRGHQLVDREIVIKQVQSTKDVSEIMVGGIPMVRSLEPLSFLFAGSPGSGKSVGIKSMLDAIRKRGDRAIVVDSGGLFLKRYFLAGDVILNPHDQRDAGWSPFAEIKNPFADIKPMAKSFIADGEGNEKTWTTYAQTFAAGVIKKLMEGGTATNGELFHQLAIAKTQDVETLLGGTAAARLVSSDAKGMAASVFGSAIELSDQIEQLRPELGVNAFSIRDWVRDGSGWMFLTYDENSIQTLRGLIAAQLDVACREICSLPESRTRRIWIIADEVASLGRIQSLPNFLQNARKYGGSAVLGLQTLAAMRDNFGRETTLKMLSCIGNWCTLRVADPETAEYMSKAIGDEEIRQTMVSSSEGESSSTSTSYQYKNQRVILPSELQNLAPCVGIWNIAGNVPACWIRLPFPPETPDKAKPFEFRDFAAELKAEQAVRAVQEPRQIGHTQEVAEEVAEAVEDTVEEQVTDNPFDPSKFKFE